MAKMKPCEDRLPAAIALRAVEGKLEYSVSCSKWLMVVVQVGWHGLHPIQSLSKQLLLPN